MTRPARPQGLSSFEGRWLLSRTIRHGDGSEARLDGEAVFTRSGPALLILDETGTLYMAASPPMQATRRYLWRAGSGGIEISFDDNRPFHSVTLSSAKPEAVHLCAPDRYEVQYDFSAWPRWRAVWSVEGPRKAYRMVSDYVRA